MVEMVNMFRLKVFPFLFITVILILNACVPLFYDVKVNGFTGGSPVIHNEKNIFVFKNEKAINPLIEDEIGEKIKVALKMKGYIPIEQWSDADYVLLFNYGIDQGNTYSSSYSYGGTRLNTYTGQLEPTTNVGSSTETIYNRQLLLRLFEIKEFSEESKPVWIGEVNSRGSSSDLREVIDYLIVGAFEHFGTNTGKQIHHRYLSIDNPLNKLEKPTKSVE